MWKINCLNLTQFNVESIHFSNVVISKLKNAEKCYSLSNCSGMKLWTSKTYVSLASEAKFSMVLTLFVPNSRLLSLGANLRDRSRWEMELYRRSRCSKRFQVQLALLSRMLSSNCFGWFQYLVSQSKMFAIDWRLHRLTWRKASVSLTLPKAPMTSQLQTTLTRTKVSKLLKAKKSYLRLLKMTLLVPSLSSLPWSLNLSHGLQGYFSA